MSMDFYGTDIPTITHIQAEVANDLADALTEALRMTDPDDRELTNSQCVRLAANYAAYIEQTIGRVPTIPEVISLVTEAYPAMHHLHGATIDDAAAIQAYLMVIYGYDPVYLDMDLSDIDDDDLDV